MHEASLCWCTHRKYIIYGVLCVVTIRLNAGQLLVEQKSGEHHHNNIMLSNSEGLP